jgi:hypothetical protein
MTSIDFQMFRDTLLTEFQLAWQVLREAHPTDHFYSFGLYTTPLAEYLMVTASTEEGLSIVTEHYLASDGGDASLTRASLRWSPCDSPLHQEGTDLLPKAQLLRANGPDPYEDTIESDEAVALVFEVAVDVLKQLDNEKIFGTDLERSRLVLGIWMGDQSDEERIEFARQLNPKRVVERFAKELDGGNIAFIQEAANE